jgi:N-acetylmuramoyl-L-alanine amidase
MINYLIIHHTGGTDLNPLADTSNQTFEIVDDYHRQKWNFRSTLGHYLGYQYFIDKTGKVTQARADEEEGAHTLGQNRTSIGICLAGNFDATNPTPAQVESLRALLNRLIAKYNLTPDQIVPHRKFAIKTCFGRNLKDSWAADLVKLSPVPTGPSSTDIEKAVKLIDEALILLKKKS